MNIFEGARMTHKNSIHSNEIYAMLSQRYHQNVIVIDPIQARTKIFSTKPVIDQQDWPGWGRINHIVTSDPHGPKTIFVQNVQLLMELRGGASIVVGGRAHISKPKGKQSLVVQRH